ncbi:MAG TPA: hypothetical protein VGX68_09715 [Thermoanaerobaculia bacterium]|nr:hypothetical protein [Thermoanaerobaculia bacterium]
MIIRSTLRFRRIARRSAMLCVCALLLALATAAHAAPPEIKAGGPRLVGTWTVTIAPDGEEPFIGYWSFNADGVASFSSAGPPNPALGNPGYGVWKQLGSGDFAATIHQNTYDPDTFQFTGTLKVLSRIHLTNNNNYVSSDTVFVYDAQGNQLFTGGGGAKGKRMQVEVVH